MENSTTPQKPRYRAPRTYANVEISLSEFDDDAIIEYLKHQGHEINRSSNPEAASDDEGVWIHPIDLRRISTLHLCGQYAQAHEVIFEIVSRAIGRNIG